jgi:hypothetical protein
MEGARATWTDERLDDLARRVESGFTRLDGDIRDLRTEVNARFGEVNARFDALQRTMLQIGAGMIVTMIVGFAGLLAAQLA